MEYLNYVFPNEHVEWGLMIVAYPYITGLVAGAFILSSLYHLFGAEDLKPVGRLSVLCALGFGAFATAPLLLHLGHPTRSFFIMIRPNLNSAMSAFGFIYGSYMVLLVLEIWFLFRAEIVYWAKSSPFGIIRFLCRVLALNVLELSPGALRLDHKIAKILTAIGIPMACVLHGYVGFIFGSLKANPWWSSPLMPIIFLLSAIVSGIAGVALIYWIWCFVRKVVPDLKCLLAMGKYLFGFLIIDVTLEVLEIVHKAYEGKEEWEMVWHLMTGTLGDSMIWVQFVIGSAVPLLLLGFLLLFRPGVKLSTFLILVSAILANVQVLSMRFNVVIGGQMLSKSGVGFHEFHPHIWGREGLVAILVIALMCVLLVSTLIKIFNSTLAEDAVS